MGESQAYHKLRFKLCRWEMGNSVFKQLRHIVKILLYQLLRQR